MKGEEIQRGGRSKGEVRVRKKRSAEYEPNYAEITRRDTKIDPREATQRE